VKIKNRKLPSQMASSVFVELQESSWDDFCDEIDEALKPLSGLRRRNARASLTFLCFALIILAATPFIIGNSHSLSQIHLPTSIAGNDVNHVNDDDGAGFQLQYMIMALGLSFMIPFLGICYIVQSAKRRDGEINASLEKICREASLQSPDIQFTLRHQLCDNGKRSAIERFIQVKVVSGLPSEQSLSMMERGARPRTPETVCSYISDDEDIGGHFDDTMDDEHPAQFF